MPIIVEDNVAKIVGITISDGLLAPSEVRSAKTDDGMICTLVAFITKNIAIA